MTTSTTYETVSTFLSLLPSGETMKQALSMVDDSFEATEPASLPYGGTYRGSSGLLDMLRSVNKVIQLDIRNITLRDGGDRIAADVLVSLTARNSGKTLDTRIVEVYEAKQGKITGLSIFYQDTAAVRQLLDDGSE